MANNNYNILIIKNSDFLIKKIEEFYSLYQKNDSDRGGIMASLSDSKKDLDLIGNIETFGVKWDSTTINIIERSLDNIIIEFITPVTYPKKFIDLLIRNYPESDFELQFYGEGLNYFGKYCKNVENNEYIEFNISRDILLMFNELKNSKYHNSVKKDLINYFLYLFNGKKQIKECFENCSSEEKLLYIEGFLDFDNKISHQIINYYYNNKDKIKDYYYHNLLKTKKLNKKEIDKIIEKNHVQELLALLDNKINSNQILKINEKINQIKSNHLISVKNSKLAKNINTPIELFSLIELSDKNIDLLINNANCPFETLRDIYYLVQDSQRKEKINNHPNYSNVAKEILKNINT